MDGYINVSGSGFEYLQNFTSEIYGERGQFAHSLKRYLAGPEWHNACRVVKTVDSHDYRRTNPPANSVGGYAP